MSRENLLIVGDSEHDANLLYAVGLFLPDPFVFLQVRGRRYVVVSDLEINRVRRQSHGCRVLSLNQLQKRLQTSDGRPPDLARVTAGILRQRGLKRVFVPANFPLGLAQQMRRSRIKIEVKPGPFFPERQIKSPEEVKKISASIMMAEVGLAEGIQVLKRSRVTRGGRLMYHNVPLTAEKLRAIIDTAILQAGGLPRHTIVAAGAQSCDPHEAGYGPLRANQPIVLDVFPRSQRTGYFGDITRTVVKGRASEAMRKLYHTVSKGQQLAFDQMRPGRKAVEIHRSVQDFFEREGYKTNRHNGRMQGFFHGTGHGLGLEIHEAPRANANSADVLSPGNVVTVEPGLYYPEIGGVRIEDVALVTKSAPRNLTKFEKMLEL
ncbi:MAG: Xaa-Pro peptidase family protein [Verrucomicrobiota bacterium]|jgi:Xaa-Pro aminopeptidase